MREVDPALRKLEIELLLTAIARHYGYDFRNYSQAYLQRRVEHAVGLEALATVSELQARILHDPACLQRFITTLSVHVTSMFRDPDFYRALRIIVVPLLRTYPFIRIWHAGCATGEEVFSMAILLEEESLYDRCRLYATDLSDQLLERASAGVFPLTRMRENTQNYLRGGGTGDFSSYYTASFDAAVFRPDLRRNMIFSQHNLVSDGPFNEFNLILCRNVLIYFDEQLRVRVLRLLCESLERRGILGLGTRETLEYSPLKERFAVFHAPTRLYRRM